MRLFISFVINAFVGAAVATIMLFIVLAYTSAEMIGPIVCDAVTTNSTDYASCRGEHIL